MGQAWQGAVTWSACNVILCKKERVQFFGRFFHKFTSNSARFAKFLGKIKENCTIEKTPMVIPSSVHEHFIDPCIVKPTCFCRNRGRRCWLKNYCWSQSSYGNDNNILFYIKEIEKQRQHHKCSFWKGGRGDSPNRTVDISIASSCGQTASARWTGTPPITAKSTQLRTWRTTYCESFDYFFILVCDKFELWGWMAREKRDTARSGSERWIWTPIRVSHGSEKRSRHSVVRKFFVLHQHRPRLRLLTD